MSKNGYSKAYFLNEYDWEHTSLTPYETCVGLEFDYKHTAYPAERTGIGNHPSEYPLIL